MSVVLNKTALTKELLAELRIFEQHAMPHRGEEILSVMNVDGRWYCMKGSELIAQVCGWGVYCYDFLLLPIASCCS